MAAKRDLNPAADNAHGPELSPLGTRPQQAGSNPDRDAAWVAQQAADSDGLTRTGVPYNEMNHGGQPAGGDKMAYDDYKTAGRQE